MAFELPSIKDLSERARNAFRSEIPGSDAHLWPSTLFVIAKVFAGLVFEIFSKLAWIDKQRFAHTATGENLDKHGFDIGLGRRAASFAYGDLEVYGTPGATLPAQTVFTRSDGLAYTSIEAETLSEAGYAIVKVICSTTGITGNTAPYATFASSNSDVLQANVNEYGIGQGSEVESDERYRERILFRKRQPPEGGALHDYQAWGLSVPGFTRIFVAPLACGPGTVDVYGLMEDAYPENYGIPQPIDIQALQAFLDSVRPATASVVARAPIPFPVDVVVKGISPDTFEVREAAAQEIVANIRRKAKIATPQDTYAVRRSWLWQAVSSATGEGHHTIQSPSTDLEVPIGHLPVVRTVTFVE